MTGADDVAPWGRPEADALLMRALAGRGTTGEPAVLGEAGTFVYRVGDLVVKVYGPVATVDRYESASRAGVRLAAAGLPIVEPLDGGRLLRSSAGAVGFWPFLDSVREPVWGDLVALLRVCHDTPDVVLAEIELPHWDPTVATRWAAAPYRRLRQADPGLADAIDEAGATVTGRMAELAGTGAALIHGGAQLQNVVVGPAGARLIDLDWLAVGPPVVDTAPVVRAHRTGVLDDAGYGDFVEAYGADPVALAGTELLIQALDFSEVMLRLSVACRRRAPVDWLAAAARPLLHHAATRPAHGDPRA